MAAGWALSIAGWIMSSITTRLLNEGFSLLGFDESEKLRDLEERLLPRLALMVEQAERSPPSRRRDHVEQWAKRLRSAFYDAEDILDVADYHRLEQQIISHSHIELKLDRMQHIISGKTSELKKVLKKLEKIIEEGSQFLPPLASTISNGNGESNPATEVIQIVTTSSALTQVIIGRDEERDKIIRMLREAPGDGEPSFNSKCYSVIGIYGVAGSGKTTLAQHVCSYERTKDHFFPVIWVHVSQSFDVRKIHQEMLEAASGEPSREFSNLDTLQMRLEAELRGKRFLLVLDDIWADKDVSVHKLDQLLSPLKVGKRGSKVLVTTRSADASVSLGAQSPLKIPDLSRTDFFDLFMHYALDGASLDDHEQEIFLMIGREIMEKLKGSPLAARLVGARLQKKLDAKFWRRVGDQDLLTDTMGALWWSYQHLDEHVRRCFAYCSIFPRRKLWSIVPFIRGHIREEEYPQLLLPASLEKVYISDCAITDTVLQNCLRGCTSLTSLSVCAIPFLRAMPCEVMKSLARLRYLGIVDCVNFTLLQGLNDLGHLERLNIWKCFPTTSPLIAYPMCHSCCQEKHARP